MVLCLLCVLMFLCININRMFNTARVVELPVQTCPLRQAVTPNGKCQSAETVTYERPKVTSNCTSELWVAPCAERSGRSLTEPLQTRVVLLRPPVHAINSGLTFCRWAPSKHPPSWLRDGAATRSPHHFEAEIGSSNYADSSESPLLTLQGPHSNFRWSVNVTESPASGVNYL